MLNGGILRVGPIRLETTLKHRTLRKIKTGPRLIVLLSMRKESEYSESPIIRQLLRGSWDLVSKVISTLSAVISNYKYSYLSYNPSY